VGHLEPSGQHSLGGNMNVLVDDAHGLYMWSPNIFIVAFTNAKLNYQFLIFIDPSFDLVPLQLLLLHP